MDEDAQANVDAIRLLRQLVNQAMVERDRDEPDDVVGVSVVPSTTAALWADGMDLDSPRYYAAIDKLLEAGALERDEETNILLANVVGAPEAFKITQGGIDLLRNSGSL